MSEELRPCPFCGKPVKMSKETPTIECECQPAAYWTRTEWQNAFAWREVDRLNAEIAQWKQTAKAEADGLEATKAELAEEQKRSEDERRLREEAEHERDLYRAAGNEWKVKFEAAVSERDAAREVAIKFRTLWGELAEGGGRYGDVPRNVDAEIAAILARKSDEKEEEKK